MGKKINLLRKYIILKYLIFHEKKELLENLEGFNNVIIEEEIKNLEKIILDNKIEFKYTSKRRERSSDKFEGIKTIKRKKKMILERSEENESEYAEKRDYDFYWKKSYEELKLLAEDKNTPFYLVSFLHRMIRKKLRKS